MPAPDAEVKLTTQQVAEVLGVDRETVRRWIKNGTIRGKQMLNSPKLGWRVSRADLVAYLRSIDEHELANAVESGRLPEMKQAV